MLIVNRVSIKGAFIAPNDAYDTDQALTTTATLIAIPAGAIRVMLAPVSGTTASRVAIGTSSVLATASQGVRVPGTVAGTNPVSPIVLDVPAGATHMSAVAESGTPTISICWGN